MGVAPHCLRLLPAGRSPSSARHQDPALVIGYLNAYRLLLADVVVVTMAETTSGWRAVSDAIRGVVRPGVDVVATTLQPRPLSDVRGRNVAYFCAAPPSAHARLRSRLEDVHGARVVHVSGNLADREALRAELEVVDAELFLVELKAAAIDVVAEAALARGTKVVLAANDVVSVGDTGLDERLLEMAKFGS